MKLTLKSLFVTVLLLSVGVQLKAQGTQQAMALLDAEQFAKAKEILEKQATASPNADNLFALGYYYVRRGIMDKAKENFEKGATLDPKNQLIKVGQAMLLMNDKKFTEAKAIIDAAIAATKMKNPEVMFRAAEAYAMFDHTNDPAEAIRLIDLIAEKTKKSAAEYQIVKGDAYLLKNDGGPSVSAYEQALLLSSNNPRALMSIGKVFKRGKNYKLAQEGFSNAILADTNFAPAYREFGELWLLAGRYKNAAFNYDKYLQKAEPTCETKLRYVKLAFLAKNYEGARRVQKEVEQCMGNSSDLKNDPDIPRMKGYMSYDEKKYNDAIQQLTDLLKKIPAEKVLISDKGILGKSYQQAGNDAEALKLFGEIATFDTLENYHVNIHDIHYKAKRYVEAAQATEASIQWNADRKEAPKSNDLLTLTRDYYFAAQSKTLDSTSTKADTLRRVELAGLSDAAMAKMQSLKSDYVPSNLWRARANVIMDSDRKKGLAIPFYEKFIEQADKEKNKREIIEGYQYLAFYNLLYSPVKDEVKGKQYIDKILEIDPENATIKRYLLATAPPPAPATTTTTSTKPGAAAAKPGTTAAKPGTTAPKTGTPAPKKAGK